MPPSARQLALALVRDHTVVRLDADHWFPLSMPARVIEELLKFEQTLAP